MFVTLTEELLLVDSKDGYELSGHSIRIVAHLFNIVYNTFVHISWLRRKPLTHSAWGRANQLRGPISELFFVLDAQSPERGQVSKLSSRATPLENLSEGDPE